MIRFVDADGKKTEDRKVTIYSKNKVGQTAEFTLPNLNNNVLGGLGTIQHLEIWRPSESNYDRVFINHLEVDILGSREKLIFPVHRWIPHGKKHLCIRWVGGKRIYIHNASVEGIFYLTTEN